jgi:3D (Asp-Asp-Asp) domain-containing protein
MPSIPPRRQLLLAGLAAACAALGAGAALREEVPLVPTSVAMATLVETVGRVVPRRDDDAPRRLGSYQLTYYWLAAEGKRPPAEEAVTLYSRTCDPLAEVSPRFAANVQMEGSGVLRDGRIVGVVKRGCDCGAPCYRVSRRSHAFGTGAAGRSLDPFRSVAVDSDLVALGSKLYIPELDGMKMPGQAPWGGFVHDGCVVADDRGGGVRGKQLDLFTAKKTHYKDLSKRLGLRRVTVLDGNRRCASSELRARLLAVAESP